MPLQRLTPDTPGFRSFAIERCAADAGVLVWTVHVNGQRFSHTGQTPESPSLIVALWRGWRQHRAWLLKQTQTQVAA